MAALVCACGARGDYALPARQPWRSRAALLPASGTACELFPPGFVTEHAERRLWAPFPWHEQCPLDGRTGWLVVTDATATAGLSARASAQLRRHLRRTFPASALPTIRLPDPVSTPTGWVGVRIGEGWTRSTRPLARPAVPVHGPHLIWLVAPGEPRWTLRTPWAVLGDGDDVSAGSELLRILQRLGAPGMDLLCDLRATMPLREALATLEDALQAPAPAQPASVTDPVSSCAASLPRPAVQSSV